MTQTISTGALLREVGRLHTQLQRDCVAFCRGTTATQCTVLTALGRSGPVTLAALSRAIGLDKGWASRAVEGLVQDGLVEKVASAQDRRTIQISLSDAGHQRLAELNQTLNVLADRAFEHIPPEHHTMVRASLELLQQALVTLTTETTSSGNEEHMACGCD